MNDGRETVSEAVALPRFLALVPGAMLQRFIAEDELFGGRVVVFRDVTTVIFLEAAFPGAPGKTFTEPSLAVPPFFDLSTFSFFACDASVSSSGAVSRLATTTPKPTTSTKITVNPILVSLPILKPPCFVGVFVITRLESLGIVTSFNPKPKATAV